MHNVKQTFSWWCFENRGVDSSDLLKEAKKIGYIGVEYLPNELWNEAIDTGLSITNFRGHDPLEKGFNHLENHNFLESEVSKNLELSGKYKIPFLTVFSGDRLGIDESIGLANTVIGLKRLVPLAEELGVTLVLELLNSKIDHPDHQCDRTSWAAAVCEIINSPNLKILFDIYHVQVMEGNIIQSILSNLDHIAHIHTAGVPGRNDIDDSQELNFAAITQAVMDGGYKGLIGHEFLPKGNPVDALKVAYQICNV